jgi:hypothetical protein
MGLVIFIGSMNFAHFFTVDSAEGYFEQVIAGRQNHQLADHSGSTVA